MDIKPPLKLLLCRLENLVPCSSRFKWRGRLLGGTALPPGRAARAAVGWSKEAQHIYAMAGFVEHSGDDRFREAFRSKQAIVEIQTDIARLNALIDPVETAKTGEEREMALEAFSQKKMGNSRHVDSMKVGQKIE